MIGRPSNLTITLDARQRDALRGLPDAAQRAHARIVLLRLYGLSLTQIAQLVGLSRESTDEWLRRYQAQGVAGLKHSGRKRGRGKGRRRQGQEEETHA